MQHKHTQSQHTQTHQTQNKSTCIKLKIEPNQITCILQRQPQTFALLGCKGRHIAIELHALLLHTIHEINLSKQSRKLS